MSCWKREEDNGSVVPCWDPSACHCWPWALLQKPGVSAAWQGCWSGHGMTHPSQSGTSLSSSLTAAGQGKRSAVMKIKNTNLLLTFSKSNKNANSHISDSVTEQADSSVFQLNPSSLYCTKPKHRAWKTVAGTRKEFTRGDCTSEESVADAREELHKGWLYLGGNDTREELHKGWQYLRGTDTQEELHKGWQYLRGIDTRKELHKRWLDLKGTDTRGDHPSEESVAHTREELHREWLYLRGTDTREEIQRSDYTSEELTLRVPQGVTVPQRDWHQGWPSLRGICSSH